MIDHVARQLGIAEVGCLSNYLEREPTRHAHRAEIRAHYGYRGAAWSFSAQSLAVPAAWLSEERPSLLLDLTLRLGCRSVRCCCRVSRPWPAWSPASASARPSSVATALRLAVSRADRSSSRRCCSSPRNPLQVTQTGCDAALRASVRRP